MVKRLQKLYQELGFSGTWGYILARVLHRSGMGSFYDYVLMAQAVPEAPSLHRSGQIQVREIDAAHYQAGWFDRPMAVIHERYRQGSICLVAFHKEEAIGCLWLIFAGYQEDEVRCYYQLHPAPCSSWDFDVYLHPQHRFGRGFSVLWDAANTWLRQHQQQWSFSRISAFNVASLRAHQRLGAIPLGRARFLLLGPVQLMVSNCQPYLHVAWRSQQQPRLQLHAPRLLHLSR